MYLCVIPTDFLLISILRTVFVVVFVVCFFRGFFFGGGVWGGCFCFVFLSTNIVIFTPKKKNIKRINTAAECLSDQRLYNESDLNFHTSYVSLSRFT